MTDQKIDARVPSDTSKTGPHTTGDSGNQAAHARRSAEECFDRGLQYDDAGNHVNALEWYRKAADQGYAVAQVILGWHYHTGEGVPQDDAEAVRWFRLATDQGHAQAQYRLGVAYRDGDGVRQDDAESVRWFRLAADQGHAPAQFMLGWMCNKGRGVLQDETEALRWYRLAADQGYAVAQVILGWHYHTGEGVPQDDAEAARWYRLAADQGDAVAQQSLGCVYREGKGVPQDDAESVRWFRLAAEQGRADAQHDLACSYRDGNGVPQDYVQAHMWYSLSASQSSEAEWGNRAKNRDLTAQRMTPDQLAEAQRLAREWDAAHPREPYASLTRVRGGRFNGISRAGAGTVLFKESCQPVYYIQCTVTRDGVRSSFKVIVVAGNEQTSSRAYKMGFILRFICGFAPSKFLRLDPRTKLSE